MNSRPVGRISIAALALALALGVASPAEAQLNQLSWTFGAGYTVPVGTFYDYFRPGATVNAEAAYPLQDRVDLTFDVDFDHFNRHPYFGTPNMNWWRLQAGVLADLLGRREQGFTVEGLVGGGLSSLKSQEDFWLNSAHEAVDIARDRKSFSKTGFTGNAGLRLRFGGNFRLNGYVGITGYWAQLGEDTTDNLRMTEPEGTLDPLSSALGYSISAGFTMRPSR